MRHRILFVALLVGFWARPAHATLAFDAASEIATATCNSDATCVGTHTPVGTPAALTCWITVSATVATNTVNSFTYGVGAENLSLTQVTGSPSVNDQTEDSVIYVYFLGSGVPAGAKDWAVDVNGTTLKYVGCITWTGTGTIEEIDTTLIATVTEDPSDTLTTGGRTSIALIVWHSGDTDPANISANAGWTKRAENDMGAESSGTITLNTPTSSDITFGYNGTTSDEAHLVGLAISEEVVAGTAIRGLLLGVLP